ncbi:aldo/keto reductase [Lentisphaera araneosa]|nr:aldo/keto reductase [Lentisphaera araneosa]
MNSNNFSRRRFFGTSVTSTLGLTLAPSILKAQSPNPEPDPVAKEFKPETIEKVWRNKQSDMTYRMLGRTGFMVSEITLGTLPFKEPSFIPLIEKAAERGVNYLDTASGYAKGRVENTLGNYLKNTTEREKFFISTKLSNYYKKVDALIKEMLKGVSASKRQQMHDKALQMIEERAVAKPGYHINYFRGQEKQFEKSYFRHVVLTEYGYKKEWREQIKNSARQLLDESLKRLQTDYVDILHFPHGCSMPEMMDDEILRELFAEFKQQGKIRASAVSFHNDVQYNLEKTIDVAYYDAVMVAYNIANHAALERPIARAKKAGVGVLAMKVARALVKNNPEWRIEKLNCSIVKDNLSKFSKAYLWGLQNPNISCCVAQMETLKMLEENLQIVDKKVELTKE